jgi:hypothetical protein
MTTPRERAQKTARSAMAKGLTALVFGVGLMLMFYAPGNQFMFIAAGIGVLGALMYTVASIIAVRTHR